MIIRLEKIGTFPISIIGMGFFFIGYFYQNVEVIIITLAGGYILNIYSDFKPDNPIFIAGLFWLMYITAYPISSIYFSSTIGSIEPDVVKILFVGGVGFWGMILGSSISAALCRPHPRNHVNLMFKDLKNSNSNAYLYVPAIVFFCLLPIFVDTLYSLRGIQVLRKYEIGAYSLDGSLAYIFQFSAFLYFSSLSHITPKRTSAYLLIFCTIFLMYFLFTGERDFLVRALILSMLYLYTERKIKAFSCFFVVVTGVFLQPYLQSMKGLFSFGGTEMPAITFSTVFSGEFRAQGLNFHRILDNWGASSSLYKGSLLNDILRFLYLSEESSTAQFGREIMGRTSGSGIGFSLLAQFYLVGGVGLVGFFGFFVGYFLQFIRNNIKTSLTWMYFYATCLFAASYSLRADFANLLSSIFKLGLVPIVAFSVLGYFMQRILVYKNQMNPSR